MTRSRISHDYVAEIDVPAESTVSVLRRALIEAEYTLSSTDHDSEYTLLARSSQPSITKHIVRAQPDRIKLSVTPISTHKCHLTVDYGLSLRFKCRLYLLLTLLGAVNSVFYVLMDHYPTSAEAKLIIARLGGLNIAICGFFGTAAALICAGFMFTALGARYRLWGQSLSKNTLSSTQENNRAIINESHLFARRRSVAAGLAIYAGCLLLWPTFVFHSDWFLPILSGQKEVFILAIAVTLLVVLTRTNRINPYLLGKVSPANANVLLSLCTIILLFALPLQAYRITRHVVALSERSLDYGYSVADNGSQQDASPLSMRTELPDVWSAMQRQGLSLIVIYCTLGLFVIVLLFYCGRTMEFFCGGQISPHQKAMQDSYDLQKDSKITPQSRTTELSVSAKFCICCLFLILSGLCWFGMIFSTSVIIAMFFPEFTILPGSIGKTVVQGANVLATVGFGPFEDQGHKYIFRLFYLAPIITPAVLLILLHLHYFWCSHKQIKEIVPFTGKVCDLVHSVSRELGVKKIRCLIDRNRRAISPYADYRGVFPQKRIVFTQRSLDFLEAFPEHGVAIIAHEVAHLKFDFISLWLMPFISRLGLVGAGFLSLLQNSLVMEDRADNEARAYLAATNRNEELVGEAAKLVEYLDYREKGETLKAAFVAPEKNEDEDSHRKVRKSFWGKMARPLQLAYQLYFGTNMYDYLHRDAQYRAQMRRGNEQPVPS